MRGKTTDQTAANRRKNKVKTPKKQTGTADIKANEKVAPEPVKKAPAEKAPASKKDEEGKKQLDDNPF